VLDGMSCGGSLARILGFRPGSAFLGMLRQWLPLWCQCSEGASAVIEDGTPWSRLDCAAGPVMCGNCSCLMCFWVGIPAWPHQDAHAARHHATHPMAESALSWHNSSPSTHLRRAEL
jgi:hypothetical protein